MKAALKTKGIMGQAPPSLSAIFISRKKCTIN